jgi:hypothetical protein
VFQRVAYRLGASCAVNAEIAVLLTEALDCAAETAEIVRRKSDDDCGAGERR